MVPVEVTAFAALAVCMILLVAVTLATSIFPRDSPFLAPLAVPVLAIVVTLAVYVLVTTTRVR
jgi:hypothetical protein